MSDPLKKFFDSLAAEWDLQFTAEDLERLSRLVDTLNAREGMDILDLGCGTGVLFDLLRRKVGSEGMVTGVDLSIQMARVAYRNFPFDNVTVVDANVINLPFLDSSFDMAVSFSAFPHFSDKVKALKEIRRVLKPKAMFHIIHLQSSGELAHEHHQTGGPIEHHELPSAPMLYEMFAASGFVNSNIKDHSGLYLASAENSK